MSGDEACGLRGREVSVVVPCRNEASHIGGLLNALVEQDARPSEAIVVDGGSTDGTVEIVREATGKQSFPPVLLVSRPGASIPAAVNAGIEAARGDLIVRLDAHSCPSHDYIAQALHTTGVDKGVVGGVWTIVSGAATATGQAIAAGVAHPLGAGDAAYRLVTSNLEPKEVDTVPFGCFSKALWEELGGFNEKLLANEDYEFNYRVRQSGRPVTLNPRMRSTYHARATLGDLSRQYFRYGWWKVETLKLHPASLRWRQALPVLLVAGFVLLFTASLFGWLAGRLLLPALVGYGLILGIGTIEELRSHPWQVVAILPAVFVIIHFAWGGGALVNLLTLGRWPRWTSGPAARV